ncbi:MAG TPA: nitrilase-related carbon-nitrogen hydrolase, partial [Bryobacteraceae bacterium]|nr:nitrilase-related carbon-nitrogen hydrolase [Bryobacteraceae bacterium]
MKIALAQTNTTVGDLCGNTQKILSFAQRAAASGAEVVVFPELTLTGYPPRDLLEKQSFLDGVEQHLESLARDAANIGVTLIVGTVTRRSESSGRPIYNTAAVVQDGRVVFRQHKMLLPSYDVFDETRYFEPATKQFPLTLDGSLAALTICEDAWNDKQFWERRLYSRDPVEELAQSGARVLVSINASPYHMGKRALRRDVFSATARHDQVPIVYVNQVGGNDQLIFDGSSFAMNAQGEVIASAASFEE